MLGLTGLAAGCASYQPSAASRPALALPLEIQQYYAYAPNHSTAVVRLVEKQREYTVSEVTLPVAGSSAPIEMVWYAPVSHEAHPLILISPIRGSDTLVVDGCARMLARSGYHAGIVKRARFRLDPKGPLVQVEEALRAAVIRHRQALDWLLAQPDMDPERVGAFGISYGAIIGSVLAAVEPRLKVCVLDLAGGPLPGVMKFSDEHSIRRDWSRSRESLHLTNRQLYKGFREVVRTDPVKLAPYVTSDNVMMLIAWFDRSVPTPYQLKLWEALGKPRADFVALGHYTSILAVPAHRNSMMRFFEDNFRRPPSTRSVLATAP